MLTTEDEVRAACKILHAAPIVGISVAGSGNGRHDRVSILQMGTDQPDEQFIFDILETGGKPFDWGIRDVLEDADVAKLMFDCPRIVDAVQFHHGINVACAQDVQLLEIRTREDTKEEHLDRLCSGVQPGVVYKGAKEYKHVFKRLLLTECIDQLHLYDGLLKKMEMRTEAKKDPMFWFERPLRPDKLQYAKGEILDVFAVRKALAKRLKVGLALFVVSLRSQLASFDQRNPYHFLHPSP